MNLKGKRRKLYLLLAVVVFVGGFWLWQVLNAPVPQYQTLIVRPGELQQNVLATGKLDALRKVDVGAQVSGQLKTLSVEIGDKVKKGQLLGVIDPEARQKTKFAKLKPRLWSCALSGVRPKRNVNSRRLRSVASRLLAKTHDFPSGSGYRRHGAGS